MLRRALLAVALLGAFPASALAAGAGPTALSLAVPPRVELGQVAEVRARLTDASGAPLPKATILFTATLAFLQGESEVVLADARTDTDGVATGQLQLRTVGTVTINAVFEGDETYAAARASGTIAVAGSGQLYVQHAGVHLPGLNAGPAAIPMLQDGTPVVGLVQGTSKLWPALSGWPIALALMIVWSLYGVAVVLLFRVARAADRRSG